MRGIGAEQTVVVRKHADGSIMIEKDGSGLFAYNPVFTTHVYGDKPV